MLQTDFQSFICFKLGSGTGINSWEDIWVGAIPPRESFSILYSLTVDPKVSVADCFDISGNC